MRKVRFGMIDERLDSEDEERVAMEPEEGQRE
jgi:hypothetical protein